MLVAEVMEEAGFRVLEAGEGATGLALLGSSARVDLLITDVGLPNGMNGRQLADAALLRGRRCRCCSSPAMPRTPRSATAIWNPA